MKTSQTILITGATAGIGKHAALHLAKRGHRVIATGRRMEALDALAAEAHAQGLSVETLSLDVTSQVSIDQAAADVERLTDGRGLDVLVNNAGYGQFGPVEQLRRGDLVKQFETNVFGLVVAAPAGGVRQGPQAERARGPHQGVGIGLLAVALALGGVLILRTKTPHVVLTHLTGRS
jgi:short-subunit dehydrogenase